MTNILHTFCNTADAVQSSVAIYYNGGFSVAFKDTDADKYVDSIRIFKKEEDAIAYAKKIANL